jgi:hypothetical protein
VEFSNTNLAKKETLRTCLESFFLAPTTNTIFKNRFTMPLPYFYNMMPYLGDNHYGKVTFTNRYAWTQQKAFYPILFLGGLGLVLAGASSAKHMLWNNNIAMYHGHLGNWATTNLNTFDFAKKARPSTEPVLPPSEETKL